MSTIQQYLTVIRLLHLDLGLAHPYGDDHQVTSLIRAVKRVKGTAPAYKLSLSLQQINSLLHHLDITNIRDLQTWCFITLGFYGLLRISAVTTPSEDVDSANQNTMRKADATPTPYGIILTIKHSKTVQYAERVFHAVIPRIGGLYCPTLALLTFLQLTSALPAAAPLLAFQANTGKVIPLAATNARQRLKKLLITLGLPTQDYNSHSLRRSGASYLLAKGVPLETVKVLGDWKSDCVFKYLKPVATDKLTLVNKIHNV